MVHLYPTLNGTYFVDELGRFYIAGDAGNPWQGVLQTDDNTNPNARPLLATGRDYYEVLIRDNARAEAAVLVSEPFVPYGIDEKCIVTSAAVLHNGRPAGAICVTQTYRELTQAYTELAANFEAKFGADARMFLVSEGGQLISDIEFDSYSGGYRDRLMNTREIVGIDSLGDEINLATAAQNTGNRQVLEALQDIENVTVRIRDGSVEMNTGTGVILKEINRLAELSQSVQDRSASIANAAEAINGAVNKIVGNSGSNTEAINVLIGITSNFTL